MKDIVLCLLLILLVSGCSNINDSKIVGTWYNGEFSYTFNNDKTCEYNSFGSTIKCTYNIEGEQIYIKFENDEDTIETTYSINDDKLNIKDSFNNDTIYTRKK